MSALCPPIVSDMCERTFTSHSADQTRAFGGRLAASLRQGSVVLLYGDLGSGKTTLAQGIVRSLGVNQWANSPSFTLINEYDGRLRDNGATPVRIYHCDFYRLSDPDELNTLALDDVLYSPGVALVEWPEIAEEWVPTDAMCVRLTRTGVEERGIRVTGATEFRAL